MWALVSGRPLCGSVGKDNLSLQTQSLAGSAAHLDVLYLGSAVDSSEGTLRGAEVLETDSGSQHRHSIYIQSIRTFSAFRSELRH